MIIKRNYARKDGHSTEIEAGDIISASPRRVRMELTLLQAYRDAWYSRNPYLTDREAADISQVGGESPWRRCSTLREEKLIEQLYLEDGSEAKRVNRHSNRPGIVCSITPEGLRRLST